MPPIPPGPIKLAILDDYQGIAPAHFSSLQPAFSITSFPNTLLPYNHPSTPQNVKDELVTRLKPFTVIAIMRERTPFPSALLKQLPNLKLLLSTGGRNRGIDLDAAKELGIHVTGAPGKGRTDKKAGGGAGGKKKRGPDSTTQHSIALILGIARGIATDDFVVKSGGWQTDFATGLSGKTFATVGLGRLGGNVAKILYESFGMRVIAWSSSLTQEGADEKARSLGLPVEDEDGEKTFKAVSKAELFEQADVLSVHYVLSDRSRGLVGAEDLARLKKSALFVNTSRGPIVDEDALFEVLDQGKIRGAALDVYSIEPLPLDSKWRTTDWLEEGKGRGRVLLSPHMGYVEEGTMHNWYEEQVEIVERWHKGEELLNVLA
jgi:lactate dehydrogenase-like 2-hydroxyacid dehydrogenase